MEYVVADVGGRLAAPTYAMFQIQDLIAEQDYTAPDGTKPAEGGGFGDAFFWLGPPPDNSRLAWEWAGEWTVTYETFRDMGAAFMVALVLIYILVVWEFGNFRIPLVIMAPIPLTLLGIIPAHFIMFQLGLGGEFTATSMIGWIALAGIIVRNSILLVDFAIHEIQKGVPVAESMIRSCKIRTRPILITALALVAGSSVIITDPIFQGMAISLLSGVLVSTLLTLIVIPLGCVEASRDMCEVAAATALTGASLPCRDEAAPAPKPKQPRRPLLAGMAGLAGKVAGFVALIFYAIRGIFLLLFDLLKNALRKKKPRPNPPRPPTPSSPPAGAGSTGDGVPSAAGVTASSASASASPRVADVQVSPAVRPVGDRTTARPVEPRPGGARGPTPAAPPSTESVKRVATPTAAPENSGSPPTSPVVPGSAGDTPVKASRSDRVAETSAAGATAQAVATGVPLAVGKTAPGAASEHKATVTAKRLGVARSPAKARASSAGDATPAKAKRSAPAKRAAQPVQKKAPRRGIRLKIDDDIDNDDR